MSTPIEPTANGLDPAWKFTIGVGILIPIALLFTWIAMHHPRSDETQKLVDYLGEWSIDNPPGAVIKVHKMGADALPLIMLGLQHANPRTRWHAAKLVSTMANERTVADALTLFKKIEPDLDPDNRADQLVAEFRPTIELAVPILRDGLQNDNREWQIYSAMALGRIGPAAGAAEPELVEVLSSNDSIIRVQAAYALWKIGGDTKKAVDSLAKSAAEDPHLFSTWDAINKLGQIGPDAVDAIPTLRNRRLKE